MVLTVSSVWLDRDDVSYIKNKTFSYESIDKPNFPRYNTANNKSKLMKRRSNRRGRLQRVGEGESPAAGRPANGSLREWRTQNFVSTRTVCLR